MSGALSYELDATSGLVRVKTAHTPGDIERALNKKEYSIGVWPEADEAPLVRYLRGDRALEPFIKSGDIHDLLAAVTVRFPDGRNGQSFLAPRSAAGPDMRYLLTGRHGLGPEIESATLRIITAPRARERRAYLTERTVALGLVRKQIQAQNRPTVLRLYNAEQMGFTVENDRDCLLVVGYEGEPVDVAFRMGRMEMAALEVQAQTAPPTQLPPSVDDTAQMPQLFAREPGDQKPEVVLHLSIWWSRAQSLIRELVDRASGVYPLQVTVTGGWHEAALISAQVLSYEEERDRNLLAREVGDLIDILKRHQAAVLGLRPLDGKIDPNWKRVFVDPISERILGL
jgi:hypothetical protein